MSRSGYTDCLDHVDLAMYRGRLIHAMKGKRSQAFFKELIKALDEMPIKELIAEELINSDGDCCAIGAVCKARGTDVSLVDCTDPESVGAAVGIATCVAAEIEFVNDEWHHATNSDRWQRVRKWVQEQIKP